MPEMPSSDELGSSASVSTSTKVSTPVAASREKVAIASSANPAA